MIILQAEKQIDYNAISKKLGIPVVLFSAQDRKNYEGFYTALETALNKKTVLDSSLLEAKYEEIEAYNLIKQLVPDNIISGYSTSWLAVKAVEGDLPVIAKIEESPAHLHAKAAFPKAALRTWAKCGKLFNQ